MKNLLFILCWAIAFSSSAQKIYISDTAFTTGKGYQGAPVSAICISGSWAGQSMDYDDGWWLAEDIVIPTGATYKLDTFFTYGYERNSTSTSTFKAAYLQIYSGIPGAGGTLVWGDSVTNILASTSFTGMYKVSSSFPLDTTRPIMELRCGLSPSPVLSSGTYWFAWSASGSGNHFVDGIIKVLPGRINPPDQNAKQHYYDYTNNLSVWESCNDGNALGFNFMIIGSETTGITEVHKSIGRLIQNYPNPLTESTNISYELTETCIGKLAVYNFIGQCVAILKDGVISAGKYEITFNTKSLPNGIYYCQLTTPFGTDTKQMLKLFSSQ
ncbi:MAG: hypothetical protein JWQ38_3628 [Flavipsychrobacter sp.]|nr:hypothetical protein [Flavipsychrobacter sp.]